MTHAPPVTKMQVLAITVGMLFLLASFLAWVGDMREERSIATRMVWEAGRAKLGRPRLYTHPVKRWLLARLEQVADWIEPEARS